jgi:alkane 1-monooxygenase
MLQAFRPLRFLAALLLSSMPVVGYLHGANYTTFVVSFAIIPLLDRVIGMDFSNAPMAERASRAQSAYFRAILYAYVPVQLGLIVWSAALVARGTLPWPQALGLVLSVGVVTGAQGITIAHELGHGLGALDRLLARVLLVTVSYGHFTIEHNRGHHVRVATREDPASARYGESFWAFLPRTLAGSFAHAWTLERARLERLRLPLWSLRNEMLWLTLLPLAFAAALGLAFGPLAALAFFGQSAMAVLLLEAVNYVEHYGLARARLADGRYERVGERHAWDADQALTNIFLFHLQRHADHHLNPSRRYEDLQYHPRTPKLPAGYAAMLPLALVPRLWFAIMNPRARRHSAAAAR